MVEIILSICFALGAAALYGTSSVLQQAAAQGESDMPIVGLTVIRRLIRRPRWLLAISLSVISFIVQAVALAFGPLALVQPLAATDLLFALPLLAYRHRQKVGYKNWLKSAMVVSGVAGFLAVSPPTAGSLQPALTSWILVFIVAGIVVTAMVAGSIITTGNYRTMFLAVAGGLVFAIVDALTKGFVDLLDDHGVGVLLSWEPYALLIAGALGIVIAQGAYRAGPLVKSLPIIDTVEPVAAVLIGATVFNEELGSSISLLLAQLAAGTVAVIGIFLLARSPIVIDIDNTG